MKRGHPLLEWHWPALRGAAVAAHFPSLHSGAREGVQLVPGGKMINRACLPSAFSVSSRVLSECGVEQPLRLPVPSISPALGEAAGSGFSDNESIWNESGGEGYLD